MCDAIDQHLRKLVLDAQRHRPKSAARQRALTQLVMAIEESGQLNRLSKHAQYYSSSAFEDLYNEACQQMYMYICQKPELYRPKHPVMAWVNSTLNYKFLDLRSHQSTVPLFEPERIPSPEPNDDYQKLRSFLETDPEGQLANYAIRDYPEVTFQQLAIARHIHGQTWQEIAAQTGISIQTLSCFFRRTLQKLQPYFNTYL